MWPPAVGCLEGATGCRSAESRCGLRDGGVKGCAEVAAREWIPVVPGELGVRTF